MPELDKGQSKCIVEPFRTVVHPQVPQLGLPGPIRPFQAGFARASVIPLAGPLFPWRAEGMSSPWHNPWFQGEHSVLSASL